MADCARVDVDLVVVAALKGLVAEEVDLGVLDAAGPLGVVLEVLEAVRLVPAGGEDVEGDLAADGEPIRPVSATIATKPDPSFAWGVRRGEGKEQIHKTHVKPKWPNRSLSFSTNALRTPCILS